MQHLKVAGARWSIVWIGTAGCAISDTAWKTALVMEFLIARAKQGIGTARCGKATNARDRPPISFIAYSRRLRWTSRIERA